MNNELKDYLILLTFIWLIIGLLMTLPASCAKAVSAFYHQVIVKDQVVTMPFTSNLK